MQFILRSGNRFSWYPNFLPTEHSFRSILFHNVIVASVIRLVVHSLSGNTLQRISIAHTPFDQTSSVFSSR